MKTIFVTAILAFFLTFVSNAQDENQNRAPQTIFSGGTQVTGWFIDFNNTYTVLNRKYAYMPGFTAGIIMDNSFRIGLAFKSLSWYENHLHYENLFDEPANLMGGYGGLYLEATPYADKLFHLTFPVIIGGGGAVYASKDESLELDENEWEWDYNWNEISSSPFFVVEPGVNVEVNITGFMRLSSGFSYRWVKGLNMQQTPRNAFNNSNFNVGIKFGNF